MAAEKKTAGDAIRLIADGDHWAVANNPDRYDEAAHNEIFQAIIASGEHALPGDNFSKWVGLNNDTALALIADGGAWAVAEYLDSFVGLNQETAQLLIADGCNSGVAWNLDRYPGLDHVETARTLIEVGDGYSVAENLDKFVGLDHVETARAIIAGPTYGLASAYLLASGIGLPDHNGRELSLAYSGFSVACYLNKFVGLDHVETAQQLIAAGYGWAVGDHLDSFEGLDHGEVALAIIAAGAGRHGEWECGFVPNPEGTYGEGYLIGGRADSGGRYVARNLDKFEGLDHTEVAHAIIATGDGEAVAENLRSFFDAILSDEPDALATARLFERETVTIEEFEGLLQAARNVASHEGGPRAVG